MQRTARAAINNFGFVAICPLLLEEWIPPADRHKTSEMAVTAPRDDDIAIVGLSLLVGDGTKPLR